MNRLKIALVSALLLFLIFANDIIAQRTQIAIDSSSIAGIRFPREAMADRRILSLAAAKTILETEASKYNIKIGEVEVFSFPLTESAGVNGIQLEEGLLNSFSGKGYKYWNDEMNKSYKWIDEGEKKLLLYLFASRKQTDLYIGVADNVPEIYVPQPSEKVAAARPDTGEKVHPVAESKTRPVIFSSLVGNWGNISASKVSYIDAVTGAVLSGVSSGSGLDLNEDGTYIQYTLVSSGHPDYRIFVSTSGNWTVNENQLVLTPEDRHYRRWDSEIISTDEHSVPEPYAMIWTLKRNETTGKDCLYIKYSADQPEWVELCRD